MDILAHTLWTGALAKTANKNKKVVEKNKKPLRVGWAALWGVLPDFFAFSFPFLAMIFFIVTGEMSLSSFGEHHGFGFPAGSEWISSLPPKLYSISHSLVIFSATFLVIWAIRARRARKDPTRSGGPYYEMLGWALHILIDIPSHAGNFYPTPFLWPVSDYKFLHGVSWANPTYMIINYSALAIVCVYFYLTRKKNK